MKKHLPSPAPIVIDWSYQGDDPNPDFQSQGPWKLHAVMLTFLMTLLLLIPSPSPEANLFAPSLKPCDSNISSCSNLLMSAMTKQTHDSLLLIGGIEPHPGPTDSDINEKRTTVIAELVCKAESQTVKDVLRLYKPAMTHSQLQRTLNGPIVDHLVETMKFLGVSDVEKYNKPTIINKLITQLQTLFPDTCAICTEEYVVSLDDTPLICCAICKQGIHPRCLARNMGKAEIDLLDLTPEEIWKTINPCEISTITYLCGYCHSTQIPSPDEGLRKKSAKEDKRHAARSLAERAQLNELINLDSDSELASSNHSHKSPPAKPAGDADDSDTEPGSDLDESDQGSHHHHKSPSKEPPKLNKKTAKAEKSKPVCPFYRKGQCRHGISGKGCSRAHPPLCRRLMTTGTKGPRGCTKGKECERFHPKMCPSSISHSECLNNSCSLYHVKGTRRMNTRQESPKERRHQSKPQEKQTRKPEKQTSQLSAETQEAFLGMFQMWQKMFQDAYMPYMRTVPPTAPPPPPSHQMQYPHLPESRLIPPATAVMPGVWNQHPRY